MIRGVHLDRHSLMQRTTFDGTHLLKVIYTMKNTVSLFYILIIAMHVQSHDIDSARGTAPPLYPLWTFFIPGATHFYDGRIGTGLVFSTLEVGLTAAGIVYNKDLKEHNSSPYYNYPLFSGLNAFAVDKCDFLRNNLEYFKYKHPDFIYDDISFTDVLKEPFRPKNVFSLLTGGFIALALAELWILSLNADYSIHDVSTFHFIDRYIDRNPALGLYGVTSLGMSWEAGVGEEYVFRNYLMPIVNYKYGKPKGLLVSTGIFGASHAFNYLFAEKPELSTIIYHVVFATVMGYMLGKNVEMHNDKIGQAIAAHTWYNFAFMLGTFLVNPKENVFGVDITLKI
jgi:membrane protease YdiL (CAAX protease family)